VNPTSTLTEVRWAHFDPDRSVRIPLRL
jgi:hypothetical protein